MELSSLLSLPHQDLLTSLAYSPSSTYLLTASADHTLALFRRSPAIGTFTPVDRWKAHDGPVGGVAWAGEEWGVVCASWGWDRRVCVWREDVDG
jgi:protein transport protein SEC13